jgi:hypothetical protein
MTGPTPRRAAPASGSRRRAPDVFSGDWYEPTDPSCRHRYRDGFTGVAAGTWNGWAVFLVTAEVMAAIIDRHHADMTALISSAAAGGRDLDEAWLQALQQMASLSWLGRLVIVDSRVRHADPTMVEVVAPDDAGRYRVGFGWTWHAVHPADVHTVHGGHASRSEGAAAGPCRDAAPPGREA